ncbi:MAG: FAD:protein FMN transferase [Emcibacter sp.]|nr:FAD:protein FMN transferase [Emcibacter sp.]
MSLLKPWIAICLFSLLTACAQTEGDASVSEIYKEEAYVFGTLVSFTIVGVPKDVARKAVKEVGEEFQHMHEDWHAWKAGELSRLNDAISNGKTMEVSDFLLPLIIQGKEFSQQSEGLFNPAMGALIEAWGFHSDELPTGALPSMDKINELAARAASMDDVEITGRLVSSKNNLVQFDFGGFGKGAALDRAEEILKAHGIRNAVINAGGDLNTLGNPEAASVGKLEGRPWKVGIRHPINWGVIASVELQDGENLYTSGNYERFRMEEGIKYAHIIDPRDGMPVQHIVSTSVIHENGALADAAATALTVAGPDDWYRIARKMGVRYVMLIDASGTAYLTPAMRERVKFETDEPTRLVVSRPMN